MCADTGLDSWIFRAPRRGGRFTARWLAFAAVSGAGLAVLVGVAVTIAAHRTCAAILGAFLTVLDVWIAQTITAFHDVAGGTAQGFYLGDADTIPRRIAAVGVFGTDALFDELGIATRALLLLATVSDADTAI